MAILIVLLFLRLAVRWGSFAALFERMERGRGRGDRYLPGLGRDMRRVTVAVFCLAIGATGPPQKARQEVSRADVGR